MGSQSLRSLLIYKQCQLKLLQENFRHRKPDIRVLKKELNSSHSSLQHEIIFIDFTYVSSLFLGSNKRIATPQKNLSKLIKSNISVQDPSNVILKFSMYNLNMKKGFLRKI